MAGYKAAEVVEALDYDFRPYHDIYGTTPEPTDGQVQEFFGRIRKVFESSGITVQDNRIALTEAFHNLTKDQGDELLNEWVQAYADLCNGHPSGDEIRSLSKRCKQSWMAWLMLQFAKPDFRLAGGNTSSGVPTGG